MLLRVLNREATVSSRGRIAVYVGGATVLLISCAALAALDAERHAAGANIHSFADALWWAATTVTTVGYGDRFPVTTRPWRSQPSVGQQLPAKLRVANTVLLTSLSVALKVPPAGTAVDTSVEKLPFASVAKPDVVPTVGVTVRVRLVWLGGRFWPVK
jgi:hypothetical protein